MTPAILSGVIPALMTPCNSDRTPDFDALVEKGKELIKVGMSAVVYCGSMGDWPLLTDKQRMEGVERLVKAGVPVIVGTGAINTAAAAALAAHAQNAGAAGLMVIPRVLSRGSSVAAQRHHFKAVLAAAPDVPAIIYNSPHYGFETRADLFFELRAAHSNLIGFKEFGGSSSMYYASEYITSQDNDVVLMVGVDTCVLDGFVKCGATGVITGIGNVLPKEILHFVALAKAAAAGDVDARQRAQELSEALEVLSIYDEGPDLVLYYKHLMVMEGSREYELHFNPTDVLLPSQQAYAEIQLKQFKTWYASWSQQPGSIQTYRV